MLDSSETPSLRLDTQQPGHGRQSSDAQGIMSSPLGKDAGIGSELDLKIPERVEDYDVVGTLFKRRGGWGKHLGWKARAFTLYQGYLCYYEAETLHDVDRSKPRGVLNLREDNMQFVISVHKSHDHPPTEFVFQVSGPGEGNKWKLCAPNREEMDKWTVALTGLLGNPMRYRSSDAGNLRPMDNLASDPSSPNNRRMNHVSSVGDLAGRGALPPVPPSKPAKPDVAEVLIVLSFVNAAFIWSRILSWRGFWAVLAMVNMIVANALLRKGSKPVKAHKKGVTGEVVEEEEAVEAPKVPSKLPPLGSTIEKAPGADQPPPVHSWNNGCGPNFRVRCGPNYRQTGNKEPSGPQLFSLINVDIYKTPCKISHIAKIIDKLPEAPIDNHGTFVPKLFVVNCQLPSEPPALISSADDGPGYNVIFYFGLTPETSAALSNLATAPPAVKLLNEYFRVAHTNPEFRGRYKAMAQVWNIKELGLPSFIEKYNGKPVLITKSGTLIKGNGYCEMDINVHRFSFPAKKGLHYLQEKFKDINFEVGFTVEGRDDSELPEVMLGVCQLNKIDVKRAFELVY